MARPSPAAAEDAGEAAVQRRPWRSRLARAWFWGAIVLLGFGWGMWSGWSRSFPFDLARRAVKTGLQAFAPGQDPAAQFRAQFEWDVPGVPAESLQARRVRFAEAGASLGGAVVAVGGRGRYAEHCPETGCAAVEFSREGAGVTRAWRYDPDALLQAEDPMLSMSHEVAVGVESAAALDVTSAARYEDGDLFAVLLFRAGHFPSYYGVARLGEAGQVLWARRDYSHHDPLVGAADTVWVAGAQLAEGPVVVAPFVHFPCDVVILDAIRAIDGSGRLAMEAPLLDMFVGSEWAPVLQHSPEPCDPFHLNSITFVREDVSGLAGVLPGDFVLSLKNLSAFAVVGRESLELKRYVRGSFHSQHSVQHLGGSKFVMFDNRRAYGAGPPYGDGPTEASRVLVLDAATGEETVLFPKDESRFGDWYSYNQGRLSLSPDRTRVLASYSRMGRAVEIRLEDGAVLAEFDDLHDVRGALRPQDAGIARWLSARYSYRDEGRR